VCWAAENRATVQSAIENIFGRTGLILDLPHNTYEQRSDEAVIIRKGSVRIYPGQQSILPSHMLGDVALIRGADRVGELLNSVSHGTGRTMSRSDSKVAANVFNFDELRASILLPDGVDISELRTEGPFAYRELDQCLELLKEFVEVEQRFRVIGYLGHLG
jgi:RNA-splicing ligase RtcB